MPVQPTYPGVYVQEVPSGVRTITGVSTSIAVFIGRTQWGPVNQPVLCLSYTDFERVFTADSSQGEMARSVRLFFLNGGTQCYVARIAGTGFSRASATLLDGEGTPAATLLIQARYPGELGESIRGVISHPGPAASTFNLKLYRLVKNRFNVDVETDIQTWTGLSMDSFHPRYAVNYVNYPWAVVSLPDTSSGNIPAETPTPFALVDGENGAAPAAEDYQNAYEILDREVDLFNLLLLPRDAEHDAEEAAALWSEASIFCQRRRAFLLIDPPETWGTSNLGPVQDAIDTTDGVNALRIGLVKDHSAIFFPRLAVRENDNPLHVGPSGAIAGLMARTDANRGVWKAPAGTEADIRGITGLEYRFSDLENGVLNPQGINTLRIFPNGIVNWGARTMDGDDDFSSEWKYIPVRRTALFIEESLYRGLKWVVFEPNDEPLWAQIRLNVGAFMHNLFRQGAFQGQKKDDAYFVKCDSETTTQNDINLGIVNVWVGFAPLKPAEFVLLYLQQIAGQIQV